VLNRESKECGAVILGGDAQGVGIARALGECGIRVIVFSWEFGIARFSRYVEKYVKVPPPYKHLSFCLALEKAIDRFGLKGWVAYPTDDDSVECMSRFGDSLGLTTWGPSAEQLMRITDKEQSALFAGNLGLSVPSTIAVTEVGPKSKIEFPAIIKPRVKEPFVRMTKKKAILIESPDLLARTLETLDSRIPRDHLLLQELVPGRGNQQLSYASLSQNGEAIAELTACRRRQHPPDFGRASTFVHTIEDAEVLSAGRDVISALNYTGLAEVEFKRHADTGVLYFLEINPRTWGWHTLVQAAHGNWIAALHAILNDESPLLPDTFVHAAWAKLITDFPTALLELAKGTLSLRELISDYWRKPMAFSCWDRRDYLPFIAEWLLLPYLAVIRGF